MTLKDRIEARRDQAAKSLREAHDYFTYSKRSWRMLQAAVKRGGFRFTLRNRLTDSVVNENDLLGRAQRYVSEDLTSATLQQFVSIFEVYLFDLLRLWLRAHPEPVSRREIKGKQILELPDKAAIIETLIDKELSEIAYDRPAGWFHYLNQRTGIGFPTDADTEQFAEIKATRDVLVHGNGVANAIYLQKTGSAARVGQGQPLNVPEIYHQRSWELLNRLTWEIGTRMAAQLGATAP